MNFTMYIVLLFTSLAALAVILILQMRETGQHRKKNR